MNQDDLFWSSSDSEDDLTTETSTVIKNRNDYLRDDQQVT